MTPQVTIYTDGACSGNPGPGGWGAVLIYGGHERDLWGGEAQTTNNRMELMGAIQALETLKRPCRVELHTDSQYVRQGITQWINSWRVHGWKTSDRKPVKNEDLWRRLDEARALEGLDPALPAAKLLGMRSLQGLAAGRLSRQAALDEAVTATRQFAKRQMTWFRGRMAHYVRFDPHERNIIAVFDEISS